MHTNPLVHMVYLSLLVRMWREDGAPDLAAVADWHSEVEHIQSGKLWKFETLNDLVAFIHSLGQNPAILAKPDGE